MKDIAIIGAGKIGTALGTLLAAAGHAISFGVRSPQKYSTKTGLFKSSVVFDTVEAVARLGCPLILAVPHNEVQGLVSQIKDYVAGSVLIDATNPFMVSPEGFITSSLPPGVTEGEYMQALLPGVKVYRAFSHVMDELLVSRGTQQPGFWAMAFAGENNHNRLTVESVIIDCGFVPVYVGELAKSSILDPGGLVFPHMFTESELRRLVISTN